MGQLLSRQATPTRPQIAPRHDVLGRRHSKRTQRSSEARVVDSSITPKASRQGDRTAPRTRPAISSHSSRSDSHPLKEVDGNVGAPKRQQRYSRVKASDDKTSSRPHQRNRKDNDLIPSDQPNDSTGQKPISHRTKPGSRQTRTPLKKECVICTDVRSLSRFPDRPPTKQCAHDMDACRRCLRTWIQSEFSTKIWNEIKCPICAERLQHDDVRQFAPHEVFRRYASVPPQLQEYDR